MKKQNLAKSYDTKSKTVEKQYNKHKDEKMKKIDEKR